jgi:hypothetical protein
MCEEYDTCLSSYIVYRCMCAFEWNAVEETEAFYARGNVIERIFCHLTMMRGGLGRGV